MTKTRGGVSTRWVLETYDQTCIRDQAFDISGVDVDLHVENELTHGALHGEIFPRNQQIHFAHEQF